MIEKPLVSYPPSIHRAHAVITALSDAFDELKAFYNHDIADLRAKNPDDILLFGLSKQQAVALDTLERNGIASMGLLLKSMRYEEDPNTERPENLVRVVLYNLRKRVGKYGATITNRHGVGYSIQNLDLARENARNGIVVGEYEPNTKFNGVPSEERWAEVMQILHDHGPIGVRGIAERITSHWPVRAQTKRLQTRVWLLEQEKKGVVISRSVLDNEKRVYLWQLCNNVA